MSAACCDHNGCRSDAHLDRGRGKSAPSRGGGAASAECKVSDAVARTLLCNICIGDASRASSQPSVPAEQDNLETLVERAHLAAVNELFSAVAAEVDAPASRPAQWHEKLAQDGVTATLQVPDQCLVLAAAKRPCRKPGPPLMSPERTERVTGSSLCVLTATATLHLPRRAHRSTLSALVTSC
jgi:hypothetical protein